MSIMRLLLLVSIIMHAFAYAGEGPSSLPSSIVGHPQGHDFTESDEDLPELIDSIPFGHRSGAVRIGNMPASQGVVVFTIVDIPSLHQPLPIP